MDNINVSAIPAEYKKVAKKELQGTVAEISYSVRNYINSLRDRVMNQNISSNL